MKRRRLIVAHSAGLDIKRRNRWWRKNKDEKRLFATSLNETYEALEATAGLGVAYEHEQVPGLLRYWIKPIKHWLYYIIVDEPLPYVAVLGMEGPRQGGPPDLYKAYREI